MVVTEEQAGKRPTIMWFPLMKTPRKETEKTSSVHGVVNEEAKKWDLTTFSLVQREHTTLP